MDEDFIRRLQRRTAEAAIGASALRNQGGPGVVKAAREALASLDLEDLSCQNRQEFTSALNRATLKLQRRLPPPARWGTARKAINLFLRDVLYNTYLAKRFGFRSVEPWLELPLDSYTVYWLRREPDMSGLPRWPGVANVDPQTYRLYQDAAEVVSTTHRVARVHLDVLWWRTKRMSSRL